MKKLLGLFTLSIVMIACKPYSDENLKNFNKEIESFSKTKNLNLEKSPSGLHYKIIKNGGDQYIKSNDLIKVTYVGELLDGTEFDKQATPMELPLNSLIPAWKEALAEMAVGDSCVLIAPPHIAYKGQEKGDIPPHSILYFKIKVHDAY